MSIGVRRRGEPPASDSDKVSKLTVREDGQISSDPDDVQVDDPRDFDPDDAGFPPLDLLFGSRPGGPDLLQELVGGDAQQPAFLRVNVGPDGNVVTAGGAFVAGRRGGAGGGAGSGGTGGGAAPLGQQPRGPVPMDLGPALMRAFGLAPPIGPRGVPLAGEAPDPDEEDLGANDGPQHHERQQVPIRNLAAFLGEAFGDPAPHPADDPANNPFAEGGHDAPERPPDRQRDVPHAEGGPAGPGNNPMSYLFSLMNAFGLNGGQVVGGPGFGIAGNAGDYVWGGEANFQALLNDLMEQAAGRAGPAPAPDDMIEKLPRVEVTRELLGHDTVKDCTVCQDDFQLSETLVSLPCRHLFHPDCIVPWLKQSGTCPVCRYALVPQPGQEGYQPPERSAAAEGDARASASGSTVAGPGGAGAGPDPSQGGVAQGSNAASGFGARPGMGSRPRSAFLLPSTARIPEVGNGSTLPGSWVFGSPDDPVGGDDQGRRRGTNDDDETVGMEVDRDDGEWTDADDDARDDQGDKSPEERAAEAAERRFARERAERERGATREQSQPIIEDVD
ncbi:hypothetical protein JCM10212_005746 [Sporobolomyces blumeae]